MRLYHRDFSGISWSGKNSGRLSGNWNLMDWERMWAEKVNDDYEFNQEKTDEKDLNLLWDQYIQNPSFKTRLPLVPFLSKYEALYQFIQVDGGEFVYYFLQQLGYNKTSDGYVIVNFNRKRRKTCMRLRADDLEEKDLDAILGPILVKYLELWAKGRCRKTCSFWKFLTTTQISLSEWRTGKVLYLYDESFLFQEYRLKQSTYQTTKNKQDLTGIFEKVVQKT